jgi:class 3 adenylate cyclase/tetratricopeptide (TPR) repeat protein
VICGSCNREVPGEFPFCPFCGASLGEAATQTTAFEERKVVSVLFCDLVGFTAASEQQDPEDVRARIRPYHARLREEIERYDGTVEKFVGDAVMAVFGAPVAHEDDTERAVRAGLGVLEAIAELNEPDPRLNLQVRVGINTGEAVVALGARPDQGEVFVTGDVVNTAARIQAVAPVNGIAVGEQTYRATSHIFEYEPLTAVTVKGKAQALPLWRPTAIRDRFGRDSARPYRTPFVGRELEKPLLIGTFERAAQQRSVQLVTIVGEPGVGKSRLIAELFAYVDAKPELIRWRQGRCLPYGEGITFWALGEIVKSEAGILESDSAEVASAKLDAAVSPDETDRQWLLQRLAPLVGIEAGPPAEREELFAAWRRFLESLTTAGPRVLVFEDLHWADEALLAFLEYLVEWSQGVPLLVLCAARPELYERRAGWGAGLRNAHTINLSPLSEQETAELVAYLVTATVLGSDLQQAIVERSGGNPLYAEEFVRLLADRGVDADDGLLPDSVQALIAARLDTLSPERKSLLQDAAVVGKVFWAGALTEIGGHDPGEVELALHELARKELVRPARTSSMEGETEHSFWHLLVRDVAYSQIPRTERARRHRAAAAWIEQKAGERVEDLAEVLAHHYVQAVELSEAIGDAEQAEELAVPARRFLALAGERALGLDTAQAEARLAQALERTPAGDPERPLLLVRWAESVFQAGRPRAAADALDEALPALRRRGEAEAVVQALQVASRVALRLGDASHVALAAEAVEQLEQETPGPTLIAAYGQLANAQYVAGAYADAASTAERAEALAQELALPEPARAIGYRGLARVLSGDPGGLVEAERALAELIEQGSGRDAAIMQNNLAIGRLPLQGPARSLADLERGLAFCEQRGLAGPAAILESNRPILLAELGRTGDVFECAARLGPALEASGDTYTLIEVRALELATRFACGQQSTQAEVDWLIDAARKTSGADVVVVVFSSVAPVLVADAPDRACELLTELERSKGTLETPYYARQLPAMVRTALAAPDAELAKHLAEALNVRFALDEHALCAARAQLAEDAGDYSEAANLYGEAAAGWQEFGNVPERAHALFGQGRCLAALGKPEAEAPLREAREIFSALGFSPLVTDTERVLGQVPAPAS